VVIKKGHKNSDRFHPDSNWKPTPRSNRSATAVTELISYPKPAAGQSRRAARPASVKFMFQPVAHDRVVAFRVGFDGIGKTAFEEHANLVIRAEKAHVRIA